MLDSYSLIVHMPKWNVLLGLAYPLCPVRLNLEVCCAIVNYVQYVTGVLKQVTLWYQLVSSVRKTVTKYTLKGLIQKKVNIAT